MYYVCCTIGPDARKVLIAASLYSQVTLSSNQLVVEKFHMGICKVPAFLVLSVPQRTTHFFESPTKNNYFAWVPGALNPHKTYQYLCKSFGQLAILYGLLVLWGSQRPIGNLAKNLFLYGKSSNSPEIVLPQMQRHVAG